MPEEDEFVDAVNEDEPVIMVNYNMRNEAQAKQHKGEMGNQGGQKGHPVLFFTIRTEDAVCWSDQTVDKKTRFVKQSTHVSAERGQKPVEATGGCCRNHTIQNCEGSNHQNLWSKKRKSNHHRAWTDPHHHTVTTGEANDGFALQKGPFFARLLL